MAKEPTFTVYIHVNDDVKMGASRTPSGDSDFVSIHLGNQASILLFNVGQAKALIDAAEDAFYILRTVEDEKARAERARVRNYPVREVDTELERLLAEEEEIERRTRYDYESEIGSNCSIENPCPGCQEYLDAQAQDNYEPF